MVDLYDLVVNFVTAGVVFWLGRRSRPAQAVEPPSEQIRTVNGPEGAYVRFTYADGRVAVRKLRLQDHDAEIKFDGRVFRAGDWTEDGHVYRERVNGRRRSS